MPKLINWKLKSSSKYRKTYVNTSNGDTLMSVYGPSINFYHVKDETGRIRFEKEFKNKTENLKFIMKYMRRSP